MKKLTIWALIVVVVVALTGCDLIFFKTLEYNISGGSGPLYIRYQGEDGEFVDVTASSSWSTSFNLGSSARPFLAFIRVVNNGAAGVGGDVTVYIREDGSIKTSGVASDGGGVRDLYAIIE